MIHIGEHMYGVVDQVPGVMHVATRVLHFNFFPCFPLGTVIVVDKRLAGAETLVKTRFSVKSLLFGYFRLASLVFGVFSLLVGVVEWINPNNVQAAGQQAWFQSEAFWTLVLGAACLIVYSWSFRWSRASYPRALQLAALIAVDREFIDESFIARGLMLGETPFPAAASTYAENDDVYRLE